MGGGGGGGGGGEGFEKYTPLSYIYTLPNSVGLREFSEFCLVM